MRNAFYVVGTLLCLSLLGGCSATSMYEIRTKLGTNFPPTGQPFSSLIAVKDTESVIYIYRNIGWASAPDVVVNEQNLGLLSEGAFVVARVSPGQTNIQLRRNPSIGNWEFGSIGVNATTKPGTRTYIRIGTGLGGVIILPWFGSVSYQTEMREVPEQTALQELSRLREMR